MPRVVSQPPRSEVLDAATELRFLSLGRIVAASDQEFRPIGRAGEGITNAAEPSAAGGDLSIEDLVELAEGKGEVGRSDDADDRRTLGRVAGVGHAGHELDLADRSEVLGAVGAIADAALHEHGRHHALGTSGVGVELVEEVVLAAEMGAGPEVVVRVDDRGHDRVCGDRTVSVKPAMSDPAMSDPAMDWSTFGSSSAPALGCLHACDLRHRHAPSEGTSDVTYPGFHAQQWPDKPAIVMAGSGEVQTYAELDARSNQLAHLFRAAGLHRGAHVALFMENQIHYMEVVWAALRSGLYITAINSYLTAPEVAYIVDDCEARIVISSSATATVVADIGMSSTPRVDRWLCVGDDYDAAIAAFPTTPIADESPGTSMLYSSGTTGRPKGVKRPLPDHPIDEMDPRTATAMVARFGYRSDMTYLSPAPMYHAAPLAFVTPIQRLGGTTVIMEKFDPVNALRAIQEHSVTHSQWVPTMFVRMLKLEPEVREQFDLSSLEVAIHAAAPCPVPVKREMIEWWGPVLLEYYAGTEGNGSTFIDSEMWLKKPGSVGIAPPGTLHICDPDGNEVPAGEEGGVYFSGGPDFEYHNSPDKTAESRLPGGRSTLGDIGYVDEDGYLFLTDRKAHMIISGGVNIYPREIEDLLIAHPAVADVAVFGVPDPDMGEQVKAVIQPALGVDIDGAAGQALAEELMTFARNGLAHYKCPKSVDFKAELPRLPTGKLYKRILRDRYWGKADSTIV